MRLSTRLTTFAILAPAALAAALPKCSTNSSLPCHCPHGTAYEQAVTFTVIGAAAKDVTALISDFFHPEWLGFVPFKTKGPNNKPGSLRTSNVPTSYGTYELTERLTKQEYDSRGGFVQRFEQLSSTVPVEYSANNGSFSGYWITIDTNYIFGDKTSVTWSAYACTTGHPIDFRAFFEGALQGAVDTLREQGKIKGENVKPFTLEKSGLPA